MFNPDHASAENELKPQWTDEQLASTASEVYFELTDATFAEIARAARECRYLVPASAGLPALHHGIRRRALGLKSLNQYPLRLAVVPT